MEHIDILNLRLSNERMRLKKAKSAKEVEYRSMLIQQMEKEISGEMKFLNKSLPTMSDDELVAALSN